MVGRDTLINIFRNKAGWDSISPGEGISGWYRWKTNHPHPWGLYTWNDFHCPMGKLVLWAMPSINHNYSVHFQLSPSLNLEQEEVLCQVLGTASPQPSPTEESPAGSNIGNTSFIHLAQQWCPPEMCKYAWTTMLGVYKLMINVKWMYGWGYIYMKPRKSSQPPDRQCNRKKRKMNEKCVAIVFI